MVVALSAADGETHKSHHRVADHIVSIEVAGHFTVDLRLGNLRVSHMIPRTSSDEAKRLDPIHRPRKENVACDLFLNKAGVRFVGIERADHIVPIGPGM